MRPVEEFPGFSAAADHQEQVDRAMALLGRRRDLQDRLGINPDPARKRRSGGWSVFGFRGSRGEFNESPHLLLDVQDKDVGARVILPNKARGGLWNKLRSRSLARLMSKVCLPGRRSANPPGRPGLGREETARVDGGGPACRRQQGFESRTASRCNLPLRALPGDSNPGRSRPRGVGLDQLPPLHQVAPDGVRPGRGRRVRPRDRAGPGPPIAGVGCSLLSRRSSRPHDSVRCCGGGRATPAPVESAGAWVFRGSKGITPRQPCGYTEGSPVPQPRVGSQPGRTPTEQPPKTPGGRVSAAGSGSQVSGRAVRHLVSRRLSSGGLASGPPSRRFDTR